MADDGDDGSTPEKPFFVDRAKSGRAACKKCKQKINTGDLRLAKLGYNPFGSGTMKMWHHVPCIFEVFKKQRKTTKKIDTPDDIGGWDAISQDDKNTIMSFFSAEELDNFKAGPDVIVKPQDAAVSSSLATAENKDDSFRAFRKICSELTNASSYLTKTSIVRDFFEKGSDGNGFKGNVQLWCRNLLPMAAKRIYNLQSKQLVKIFSDIFGTDQEEMLEHLEQGDVAETIGTFFEKSRKVSPVKKASLSLNEVDSFLEYLSKLTRETDQTDHFKTILLKCTTNDLKIIIRLIKHDLRINAGPKHILEALHPDAYQAFQASRDLAAVVKKATSSSNEKSKQKGMSVGVKIMTPVLPMLAEACKSVEQAFKRCPSGMYSEIKYDGERVQLHKQGDNFKYFSRSLKPVLPHKVNHFHKYIPQAFPHGKDLILDSEILMVDTNTGQPLPFGTLGVHKKSEFKDATVCLFVFDCIYFNGESLIDKSTVERRKVLRENMTEIPNRVMFSEMEEIHKPADLEGMMERVFRQGLEGLVLKGLSTTYEPGKRHWLKVKKDYLFGGAMADTADLVVLGAWYGTGRKGGIMSIFLMGCFDEKRKRWLTVTKVHGGHDDKTLDSLQKELKMVKISRDANKVPSWLHCSKTMVPDFVAEDPENSPVWEITGAEFTCNQVHTADGISIRFPRVTRIRQDKDAKTATTLSELKKLYATSKDTSGFTLKRDDSNQTNGEKSSPVKSSSSTAEKDDDKYGDETEGEDEEKEPTPGPSKSKEDPKLGIEDYAIDTESDSDNKEKENAKKRKHKDRSSSPSYKKIKSSSADRKQTATDTESGSDTKEKENGKKRKHKDRSSSPSYKKRKSSSSADRKQNVEGTERHTSKEKDKRGKERHKSSSRDKESSKGSREHSRKGEDSRDKDDSKSWKYSRKDEHSRDRSKRSREGEHSRDRSKKGREDSRKDEDSRGKDSSKSNREYSRKEGGKEKKKEYDEPSTSKAPSPKKSEGDEDSGAETEVDEDLDPKTGPKIDMANPLPDVFVGNNILLHRKIPDINILRRFIIAYGGCIYDEGKNTSLENGRLVISHVVYPSINVSRKIKDGIDKILHVSLDWLWDSIKAVRKQDENRYKVKVNRN